MKKIFFVVFALFSVASFSQNTGIGFRLGDLSGITFKKYFSGKAFEISVGRSHLFINDHWYNEHFDHWYKKNDFNYVDILYGSYYRDNVPLGLQLHFLKHNDIDIAKSDVGELDWYYGFGGQFRYQSYHYEFWYKINGDPDWHYNTERINDIDLGADGVIGLEYIFTNAPISVFLDFTLFMEVVDDPFIFNGQGGIGARYNF